MNSEPTLTGSAGTAGSPSFREVYLIMVESPSGWRRVGQVYLSKENAKDWVPFVKSAWHGMTTRTKRVRIPLVNGKPTAEAVKRFDEEFLIDLS